MWIEGPKPEDPVINWNAKLETELKGTLEDYQARRTLAQFLYHNIGFTVEILTGIKLFPYQRLILKGWLNKNFCLTVAGRGVSKSTLASIFAYFYAIFNPGVHILIVSETFRSSRRILDVIDGWASRPEGKLLRQTFAKDMQKAQDLQKITFGNGSSITAVPLGASGEKLRGFRCNVLLIDEGLRIPQQTIDQILKPFLIAGASITEKQRIREREDKLIAAGKMKEEDRIEFKSDSKMIIISSASYKWEHLYTIYQDYLDKIHKAQDSDVQDATYLVHQLSYEIAPPELLDPAMVSDIESGATPQGVIDREYRAIFTDGTDGYFSPKKMGECTVPNGERPIIEIRGEPKAQYILGIDPNVSSSPSADHFAMCVLKLVDKGDGTKIPMVVHQYGHAGCELKFHILYLLYILRNFNIVYIAVDTSQGSGMDFINICNESEIFKSANINLLAIDADFGKSDFSTTARQIKRSYNLNEKRIVQKQYFHSDFQRAANEYLKSCIDFKKILFAGKARSVGDALHQMGEANIGNIAEIHPLFANGKEGGSIYQFIEQQDIMIDLVKNECAMIEPKMSVLGNISFDMAQNMKRAKGPSRPRKDNYSALFLANWAAKFFMETQAMPEFESSNMFEPTLITPGSEM